MPLDMPLTLILSPLRAGRGNSSDTRVSSRAHSRRAAAPNGSLSLSEGGEMVRCNRTETAKGISKEVSPTMCGRIEPGRWSLSLLLSSGLCCWNFPSHAAAPTLDHLYPVAVQAGSTNAVTAIGKFDPWPPKVWVDALGIVFQPQTNTGKFTVEIATNTPAGPHLVRVLNEQGASGPRFLIVTGEPQAAEQEPNDDFMKPQAMDHLPVSLNGRLDKSGDVDSFGVTLEAGQTLIAWLEAYTLASPMDAVLRLVDSRGVQLALNDDDGRTLDPLLAWTANAAGTYILQVFGFAYPAVSDVKFTGGNACVYRLNLSRGRCLHYALPLGVQRGARTKLRLFGWNMDSGPGAEFEFDGSGLPVETGQVTLAVPDFENALTVPVGDGPELIEREPNNSRDEAPHLDVPFAVTGCIGRAGDEDWFMFSS